MSSGISSTGFTRKRLDEILADKNTDVRGVFGPDINLDPQAPDGQINAAIAESDANLWELLELAYNAFNPNAAIGSTLDALVALNGIVRLPASKSTVTLDFTGTNGTLIPTGSVVSSTAGDQFETVADATIAGGVASVLAQSVETAQIAAVAGSITTIETPVVGWDTVTNPADALVGRLEETDAELRVRRRQSVAFPSQSMVDSIYSAVANVEDVRKVTVLENDTDSVDGNGQEPHSVQVVVTGGTDADIAQQIFNEKPAGIEAVGTTTEVVNDSQGLPHDIGLTRPTEVPIYVDLVLVKTAEYPSNGDDLIRAAIVAYGQTEFDLGDDVIYTRLYTPINEVPGHSISSLKIGRVDPPLLTTDVPIAFDEVSDFDEADIDIA
jgi:uncharacterized phage protein gp47/JayE